MPQSKMNFDRYHATMGNFSLKEESRIDKGDLLADKRAVFYATQRKMPFGPCVGHKRLIDKLLRARALDIPRLRFLRQEKADLSLIADRLASSNFPFTIRAVAPGTIMFANQPFADVEGPFALTQMLEIDFEHAFDRPMTVAGNAFRMRLAAGNRHLSDFSQRRDGSLEMAIEDAEYSYIGGFDDTSNMEAAFQLDINAVGTMAHYLIQAYIECMYSLIPERDAQGRKKHFQQIGFERWLDAHPHGTTLLLDTISLKLGVIHAIRAADSSEARKKAFKFARVDSGNLAKNSRWMREMFDANGLTDVEIMPTGDLDDQKIREIVNYCPRVAAFGVGTKLAAETTVAGVIFKLCSIGRRATLKCSETKGKETIPGLVQVWRCVDDKGYYVKDVTSMIEEAPPMGDFHHTVPLLKTFYGSDRRFFLPSPKDQKEFVTKQVTQFKDIANYPVEISESLKTSKENIVRRMHEDDVGEDGVTMVPYPD